MSPTAQQVETARELLASLGDFGGHVKGDDIAHLEVHGNEVVGAHLVPASRSTSTRSTTASRRTSA